MLGRRLGAREQPLLGKLEVEAGGKTCPVLVRAEVPVEPFPEGVLLGARGMRELARKATDHAREAAPLFESGAVARWYEKNGWNYPVEGPAATGKGAVQQTGSSVTTKRIATKKTPRSFIASNQANRSAPS